MIYVIIVGALLLIALITYFVVKKKKSTKEDKESKQEEVKNVSTETQSNVVNAEANDKQQESGQDLGLVLNEEGISLDDDFKLDDKVDTNENNEMLNENLEDMFNNIDSSLFDFADEFPDDREIKRSEIMNEIHRMSPKMKAILLCDVLDKKYF